MVYPKQGAHYGERSFCLLEDIASNQGKVIENEGTMLKMFIRFARSRLRRLQAHPRQTLRYVLDGLSRRR